MCPVRLNIKVQPGARANEVLGYQGGVLRLRVTAPPDRGKANEAVVLLLAVSLDIPKSRIALVRGAGSREKVVEIDGLEGPEVRRRLERLDQH